MRAIVLLVLGGAAWYFTTAEERLRLWRGTLSLLLQLKKKVDLHRQEPEPFLDALRARAALPFVTIGLVGIHILAFAFVIVGGGALSDPEGLVAWGGMDRAPRTASGGGSSPRCFSTAASCSSWSTWRLSRKSAFCWSVSSDGSRSWWSISARVSLPASLTSFCSR
jgi:hypothetical protein